MRAKLLPFLMVFRETVRRIQAQSSFVGLDFIVCMYMKNTLGMVIIVLVPFESQDNPLTHI